MGVLSVIKSFLCENYLGFEFSKETIAVSGIYGIANFTTYIVAVAVLFGILKSISISYYSVKPRWLFQVMMWSSIFTIGIIGGCNGYYLVCLLFAIMTCNPSVNSGNVYFIPHCLGAIGAIVLMNIMCVVKYSSWVFPCISAYLVAIILLLSIFSSWFNERKLYFIEVCTIYPSMVGLLYNSINAQ